MSDKADLMYLTRLRELDSESRLCSLSGYGW